MKPKCKVTIAWTPEFAYAIGLITTDGCLSPDGRHITLTSKDEEQLNNFLKCLNIKLPISVNKSGLGKDCLRVQLGDVNFYRFLTTIGLMPRKSKVLNKIDIPELYFIDFLRGHFDGDGTFYSYWDSRWRSSYLFYSVFLSASKSHVEWLQQKLRMLVGIKGYVTKTRVGCLYQLRYAKAESLKLISKLYYDKNLVCLTRKKEKIIKALHVENLSL